MKRLLLFLIMILSISLLIQCSESISKPDAEDPAELEFKAIESGFNEMTLDDPGETTDAQDSRVARLGQRLRRLNHLLQRLTRYESNHPNEEAHKLIVQAKRYLKRAIQNYRDKKYRAAYNDAKEARRLARGAIRILRAQRNHG